MESPSTDAPRRLRWRILLVLALVVALGLPSRSPLAIALPDFYILYVGDGLYALAFFLGFAFLLPRRPAWQIAILTLLFTYAVEISELFESYWPEILRSTRLGRLIMGYGFKWTDIAAYTIGVAVGWGLDRWLWIAQQESA